MKEHFSIQFVSQVTGINAHTIRAWEKRYSAVVPKRDENKRRLYAQQDIDRLKKIHFLCSLGNNVSDIATLDDENLEILFTKYSQSRPNTLSEQGQRLEDKEDVDINTTLQNLIMAITHYKLDIISHELEKVQDSLSARDFTLNLIMPLLTEIGLHLASGSINIGMQHAIISIIKLNLGKVLFKKYQNNSNIKKTFVMATPEGEFSEIPILLSAILCSHYQLKFYYFGVNISALSLAEAAKQIKADYILTHTSKSYVTESKENFVMFNKTLLEQLGLQTNIWTLGLMPSNYNKSDQETFFPTLLSLDSAIKRIV